MYVFNIMYIYQSRAELFWRKISTCNLIGIFTISLMLNDSVEGDLFLG